MLRTMLLSSLYDEKAAAVGVDTAASDVGAAAVSPTADVETGESSSTGSWPFAVVGGALALGIAGAKWLAWGSRDN